MFEPPSPNHCLIPKRKKKHTHKHTYKNNNNKINNNNNNKINNNHHNKLKAPAHPPQIYRHQQQTATKSSKSRKTEAPSTITGNN